MVTSSRKKPITPGNIYDAFVKRMFGRVLVFVDFLVHYADPGFVAEMNLKKIKPAPTHYIGKTGDERIADLIFQCPLKNGSGTLMAIIVFEHQSGNLKEIPQKLHRYISAIWDAEKKEGRKILSAPYFIVLRTGKKPLRGAPPRMSDVLPKDRDGKPLGHVPEMKYDVFDLPAWDFDKLVGGPVLRLALGILKKMIEESGEEFSEAMLPLLEMSDAEQKIELTKELLQFAAKAFAVHNRRLDTEMVSKALVPIFKDEEQNMIKSIFDEKYDEGFAVGIAEGEARGEVRGEARGEVRGEIKKGREMLLKILHARFPKIPKNVENTIRKMTDPVALDSWAEHALSCRSMNEFTEALK